MNQSQTGKAFEFACVRAMEEILSGHQAVEVVENKPLLTARRNFTYANDKQENLMCGAFAAVNVLCRMEPRLSQSMGGDPLKLIMQEDAAGQAGDVRDILCRRDQEGWQIGISCKHNHMAVKHSRLSGSIDFGEKWLGIPCSREYFDEIRPIFTELTEIHDRGVLQNRPVLFSELEDVAGRFYRPVLEAFIRELTAINARNTGIPARMIHYLMGEYDYYKVMTDDPSRTTKLAAVNINGTLNSTVRGMRHVEQVPRLQLPTEFVRIDMKRGSSNTVEVICDKGWTVSMRIHTAKSEVEASLKFDIKLVGTPEGYHLEYIPWSPAEACACLQ